MRHHFDEIIGYKSYQF